MFELRYWNIKVSVIQPGTFDSPMITDIQNGPKYEAEQYNQMISNFRKTFGCKYHFVKEFPYLVISL